MDRTLDEEIFKIVKRTGLVAIPLNSVRFITDRKYDLKKFKKNLNYVFGNVEHIEDDVLHLKDHVTEEVAKEISEIFLDYFKEDLSRDSWNNIFFYRDFTDDELEKYEGLFDFSRVMHRKINNGTLTVPFLIRFWDDIPTDSLMKSYCHLTDEVKFYLQKRFEEPLLESSVEILRNLDVS